MIPTPSTSHTDFRRVYEPAEDSFLLVDTLASPTETSFLARRFSPPSQTPISTPTPLVLEIGIGSGVILAFITAHPRTLFGRSDVLCLGTDLNAFACETSAQTIRRVLSAEGSDGVSEDKATHLACLTGSLASPLRAHNVDLLVFNPPYVPSEETPQPPADGEGEVADAYTRHNHLLALATDGGPDDGMDVTRPLLAQLPEILTSRGVAYVLLCARNGPEKVRAWLLGHLNRAKDESEGKESWRVEIIGRSGGKGGWERLAVVRIWVSVAEEDPCGH